MTLTASERILILRRRMKLSQAEFGELLGVTSKTVQNWELGKTEPVQAVFERLKVLEQRQNGK